ncbi:MAG: hypothetical protein Q9216_001743 [Gyalolechia sp. 2 TL-2023]
MSFRKRNVGLSGSSVKHPKTDPDTLPAAIPGVRASPLDGRLTTSTGTPSLDDILGHSGLALGNSVLIEENGTTDFGATLLRYFAAEGVVQGHQMHVVGVGESWARELPAVSVVAGGETAPLESLTGNEKERMKIAWRYERLGDFGAGPSSARATPALDRKSVINSCNEKDPTPTTFCHTFDLTKRLTISDPKSLVFIPIHLKSQNESPFLSVLHSLRGQLTTSPNSIIHRLIIPNLLSPALYPPHASNPQHILQFLHSLRALLRQYPRRLVTFMTLPLMLYPRATGLTRWMELLCDGVIELSPFPHSMDTGPPSTASGAATAQEEKPQGMVNVHRLPVFYERGGGGILGDDLAFTVSRRKFVIRPFNLPPVEGDIEAQAGEADGKPTKVDIDF